MTGNGVYLKSIDLDATWQSLAPGELVMNATLIAAASNSADAQIRLDGGDAQTWPAGAAAKLEGADLSRLEVKGTEGDIFTVAGNTR